MHQAVELILARMKSNPEDFNHEPYEEQTKWESIVNHYSQYFTKEEIDAVNKGYEDLKEYNRVKKLDHCIEAIYQAMAGDNNPDITEQEYETMMNTRMNTKNRYDLYPQNMSQLKPPPPPPQSIYTGFSSLPNGGQK